MNEKSSFSSTIFATGARVIRLREFSSSPLLPRSAFVLVFAFLQSEHKNFSSKPSEGIGLNSYSLGPPP